MHRVNQHMLPVLEIIGLHRLQASDTVVCESMLEATKEASLHASPCNAQHTLCNSTIA